MPAAVEIRVATVADAAAIAAIYNHEVATSTATLDIVERSLDEQQRWISDRSGAFTVIVAVSTRPAGAAASAGAAGPAGEVVGFASLSPFRERAAYRITTESSVYVSAAFARQGVGRALVERIVDIARASGFHSVIARIESTREASLALHRACGYEVTGTEHEVGRKFGRFLSMTTMQHMLS